MQTVKCWIVALVAIVVACCLTAVRSRPCKRRLTSGSNVFSERMTYTPNSASRWQRSKSSAYAAAYQADTLTNDKAQALLDEALQIEQAEVDLKRAYVPKFGAVLSSVKVARYLQIENKIRAILKFELAAEIPLAK